MIFDMISSKYPQSDFQCWIDKQMKVLETMIKILFVESLKVNFYTRGKITCKKGNAVNL